MHSNDPVSKAVQNNLEPSPRVAPRALGGQTGWENELSLPTILERARDLDRHALGLLYERYLPTVYRYTFLRVGDTHTAEDLTSEAFFSVVSHIQQLRANDEITFVAWLLRIARNVVLAHYRTIRAHPAAQLAESLAEVTLTTRAEEGDPLTIITAREDWAEVVAALNALTEDQRNVVLYRCLLGYTTEEVAQLLDKRPGAIRALQFRALSSLVRLLSNSGVSTEATDKIPAPISGRRRVHGTGR
jgi:RNA polymerase sigma-70 factor (ECF subfamily)